MGRAEVRILPHIWPARCMYIRIRVQGLLLGSGGCQGVRGLGFRVKEAPAHAERGVLFCKGRVTRKVFTSLVKGSIAQRPCREPVRLLIRWGKMKSFVHR